MSHASSQVELRTRAQQLLQGPLKHIRGAALAAALLPLASVAAAPASQQNACGSGGLCGVVYNDTNNNDSRCGRDGDCRCRCDRGQLCDGSDSTDTFTDVNGFCSISVNGGCPARA
jgi:hypothetical protein